jgi:glycosyltransferase involved in cell wall biosynthesis
MGELKVLNILNELRPSGAEVMICNARDYWRKWHVRHDILATAPTAGVYAPEFEKSGFKVYHYPYKNGLSFFRSLYRLIKDNHYDIVHVHTESINFPYSLTARLAGVQVVRSIHNCFDLKGLSRIKRLMERQILRYLGSVNIACSVSVSEMEQRRYGNPTVTIPNWYDHNRFFPAGREQRHQIRQELGIKKETLVFITVANCNHVKNHPALIQALAQVKDDMDFLYLHAGGEEDEEGFPERKLAEDLGIAGRIRFLGFVSNVPELLRASDFYVMPSLYEGLGNASLEAMACGLPTILTDVAGSRDLKFIQGTFWAKPEADSLAAVIRAVSKIAAEERDRLGRQAHDMVKEHFGIERGVSAYVDVYRRQMAKG